MAKSSIQQKFCNTCQETKPVSQFYKNRSKDDGLTSQCKSCVNKAYRKYMDNPKRKEHKRARDMERYYARPRIARTPERQHADSLKRWHGMTVAEYNAMVRAQFGKCAICGSPPKEGYKLFVDHCHETGKIRGLLCNSCNMAIGKLGDTLESLTRVVKYLEGSI